MNELLIRASPAALLRVPFRRRLPLGVRPRLRFIIPVVVAVWVGVGSEPLGAQSFTLKGPEVDPPPLVECPPVTIPNAAPAGMLPTTDSLLAAGSRAAILGDHLAARDLFREASALAPRDPTISYRLARTLDERGETDAAIQEYCRYLTLVPNGAESGELRQRVGELAAISGATEVEAWKAELRAGIEAFEEDRFGDAAEAFTRAIELRENGPEAYYNRGVARLSSGREGEAIGDFQAYLAWRPEAQDRQEVLAHLARLDEVLASDADTRDQPGERRGSAPATVLVQGLVIPGLAQHATGRTVFAAAVLAAAGGAAYFGAREQSVVRVERALDPFGNPYEYEVDSLERPNLVTGVAVAVAISLAAAVEGYLYARRGQEPVRIAGDVPSPLASSPRMQFTFSNREHGISVGVWIQSSAR